MKVLNSVQNYALRALNRRSDNNPAQARQRYGTVHIYEGTVAQAEKNRRRAKNRVARKSRRANRR